MNVFYHQFKTFANSAQNIQTNRQQEECSRQVSQREHQNHEANHGKIKKSKKKSKGTESRVSTMSKFKYPTNISLLMSDVSFPGSSLLKDLPLELLGLQVEVTEELLAMREDKLTLLQQYNNALGNRFQIEREVTRMKKRNEQNQKGRQSSQTGGEGDGWMTQVNSSPPVVSPPAQLHPIFVKNQELKEEYNQIRKHRKKSSFDSTDREYYQKQMQEIEKMQQKSRQIQEEIAIMDQRFEKINEQRFETFFPNQKQKKSHPPQSSRNHQELLKLTAERQALYHKLIRRNSKTEEGRFLHELFQENKELQRSADGLLKSKKTSSNHSSTINLLRKRIEDDENAKKFFFEDLRKFKQQIQILKAQNSKLARKVTFK